MQLREYLHDSDAEDFSKQKFKGSGLKGGN